MKRFFPVLVILAACSSDDPYDETLPPCTFDGAFSGGVAGSISVSEENCSGRSSGNSEDVMDWSGGSWLTDQHSISVMPSTSLVLSPGSTAESVPTQVAIYDLQREQNFWNGDNPCWADIHVVEEITWWAGTETFVGGEVWCEIPLSDWSHEDTPVLEGVASFYYRATFGS